MNSDTQSKATGLANITEAASYLGVSRNAIYKLIKDGNLKHVMIGSHRRVQWESIYKFAGEDE